MSNLDLSKLNPEQERVLCDAYRYIRQRAVWLRAQKKITTKDGDTNPNSLTMADKNDQPNGPSLIE